MEITHIIWDFNGTVLDDAAQAVEAVNDMLAARSLPPTDLETYKDTLVMPLDDYYKTVGIHCDDIAQLSTEFRASSERHPELARIFGGVYTVIGFARERGIKNVLMSSLYHPHLVAEVERYGIGGLFDGVIGLPDRNLGSKYQNARNFIQSEGADAGSVLFIGDLESDAMMAKRLGAQCVLISNGHMSHARCAAASENTYDDIEKVIGYIQRA